MTTPIDEPRVENQSTSSTRPLLGWMVFVVLAMYALMIGGG